MQTIYICAVVLTLVQVLLPSGPASVLHLFEVY